MQRIDQFCAGFATGDAISNEALLLQKHLQKRGIKSQIFAEQFPDRDAHRVVHIRKFKPKPDSILVYHHSTDTELLSRLPSLDCKKILIYHNVTPAEYVRPYNRGLADRLQHARDVLKEIPHLFQTVLADSAYNASDLERMGYKDVKVMPVALSPIWKTNPQRKNYRFTVLFVGRVFPNKRHQDLLKTFYFLKKIQPDARLRLVGHFHPEMRGYTGELKNLMRELDLRDVEFTGMVSDEQVAQAYADADVFLSMSEHEGFFVPLIESMHFRLPILAYNSSVIPETLGGSGVMFTEKNFPMVAETIVELHENSPFRESILEAQTQRAAAFSLSSTTGIFDYALDQALQGDLPKL